MATLPLQPAKQHGGSCTDHVVGAILSGWRYDISGISPELRRVYEDHLRGCAHCHQRQRLHRAIDLLLFTATALSFTVFLLATLVLHRLHHLSHVSMLRVHLLPEVSLTHSHFPATMTLSLQAIAGLGVLVSMLLWVLVTIATPVPDMVSGILREHVSAETRDRLWKQAA